MSSYRIQSLFGVPLILGAEHCRELLDELSTFAQRLNDGLDLLDPVDRNRYLAFLADITSPVKRESSIRALISRVAPSPAPPTSPFAEQLFHHVEARRWILSREGVEVLELLAASQPQGDEPVRLSTEAVAAVAARVAEAYRATSCARLDKVSALLNGTAGPLLPAPLASLFLLLVNRTTAEDRALPRYPRERHQLVDIARAFREGVLAIGRLVKPGLEPPKLLREWEIGGYAMSEINRRLLPPGLTDVELDSNGDPGVELVYIHPDSLDDAEHLLAIEIRRRFDDHAEIESFFDQALATYSSVVRPTLATAGLAHERPMATNRLRQAVLAPVPAERPSNR